MGATARIFHDATNSTFVRLTAPAGACAADAIYIRSTARYNNGQPADTVRLQPMDGIVLARNQSVALHPRLSQVAVAGTNLVLTSTDLTAGFTYELQRSPSLTPLAWSVRRTFLADSYSTNLTEPLLRSGGFYRLVAP